MEAPSHRSVHLLGSWLCWLLHGVLQSWAQMAAFPGLCPAAAVGVTGPLPGPVQEQVGAPPGEPHPVNRSLTFHRTEVATDGLCAGHSGTFPVPTQIFLNQISNILYILLCSLLFSQQLPSSHSSKFLSHLYPDHIWISQLSQTHLMAGLSGLCVEL